VIGFSKEETQKRNNFIRETRLFRRFKQDQFKSDFLVANMIVSGGKVKERFQKRFLSLVVMIN
jgi:hypothetical protein